MNQEPIKDKWRSFNWNVIEAQGNDLGSMIEALNKACGSTDKPSVIIAHTIKGAGVSYMENNADFHGKAPNAEEMKIAFKELEN